MKKVYLTTLALIIVTLSFCQQDTTNIKNDTISYKQELQEFYGFLSKNYNQYKMIDFDKIEIVSILEKECNKIIEIINSRTKYIEQEMLMPVYISDGIFTYYSFDVGGKNYPTIYTELQNLQKIVQKMLKAKNDDTLKKMNSKLNLVIDRILNKKED